MVKYTLIDRGDALSKELAATFHELAARKGLKLDVDDPHVVVTIGGDGTLLEAFHQNKDRLEDISFVGVHTGHLGFYTDWTPDEIEQLVGIMAEETVSTIRIVEYPLVKMKIYSEAGEEHFLALNEYTVKCLEGTLVIQVDINDQPFEMFRGDGLCVSSPSGSTAYNKSLGGAILHPSLESLQLAEIASINNRVYRTLGSSLVIPKHHELTLRPHREKDQCMMFSLDHLNFKRDKVEAIHFMVADKKVRFARFRKFPFWTRVKEAFIDLENPAE